MVSRQLDEEVIFHVARGIPDGGLRCVYLEQICAGDQALRNRVEALLEAHEQSQEFLASGHVQPAPTVECPALAERPGAVIGRYRLMEKIGEGGMGTVFAAEQDRPIRRKVAVKVIKPGMDSKDVVARFEAERQALALMDHPNIAKVLDAGNTETGRPYFVMELVRGIPITEYCDSNKLSVNERLQLFVPVCHAVQHAHQKGIIHRDLKPSNVLVTLHDGAPVPKIIDFGVAKALNQRLTERTVYTRVHQAIGTLAYMSPEQAELSGLDVDTRADIYGLGVMLYELLTGSTPLDAKRLNEAAFHEACRIIREEEPPRASTKVSSLGATATAVSAQRKTIPQDLARQLHGDLDWIMVKALEKDRTHRYESASAFAADVQHYLDSEPIDARPPSTAYRLHKFAARHRAALVTSTLVLATLITGLVVSTWMAIRLQSALRRIQAESFERAVVAAALGDNVKAEDGLRIAGDAGASKTDVKMLQGLMALNRGEYEKAVQIAHDVLGVEGDHVGARALLVSSEIWRGNIDAWAVETNRLAALTPQTDADRLLMAHALVLYDSPVALELLKGAERMKHSPVGLMLYGLDHLMCAEDEQDFHLYQRAVTDFEYIDLLLPDSPGAVAWRATAIANAIEYAKNHDSEYETLVEQGQEVLTRLPKSGSSPFADLVRWKLCRALDDPQGASDAIRLAGKHGIYCWHVAVDCLTQPGSSADAASAFTKAMSGRDETDAYVRLARAFVVHDLPNGAQQVRTLIRGLENDPRSISRMLGGCALCLAGDLEDVRAFASQGQHYADRGVDRFANGQCLDFLANPSSTEAEKKLLDAAQSNGYAWINAHFVIGMTRLAAHDRLGAIEHFKSCSGKTALGNFSYEMARALLWRMKADSLAQLALACLSSAVSRRTGATGWRE